MTDPVRMVTLSTGERVAEVEWQCRMAWEFARVLHWHETHPAQSAAIWQRYIEAMQGDAGRDAP